MRKIESISMILKGSAWYVYGYCLNRMYFRMFKISRMRDLQLTKKRDIKKEFKEEDLFKERSNNLIDLKLRFSIKAIE